MHPNLRGSFKWCRAAIAINSNMWRESDASLSLVSSLDINAAFHIFISSHYSVNGLPLGHCYEPFPKSATLFINWLPSLSLSYKVSCRLPFLKKRIKTRCHRIRLNLNIWIKNKTVSSFTYLNLQILLLLLNVDYHSYWPFTTGNAIGSRCSDS